MLGEGPLPVQCMGILQDKGFQILAFITRDDELRNQATKYPFPVYRFATQLEDSIQPDYIFSINNGIILKPAFIAKAKSLVINYHDSPLPKYAGMYAPNWALLHQEKTHAVSWHILDEGIDTGDILEQECIDLEPLEPIWSVNMKCFGAALLSFERLVENIINDTVSRTPQNTSQRSYFPLMARPDHLGLISAESTIKGLELLQSVTTYGPNNDNEFLLPHIYIGKDYFTIGNYRLETPQMGKPGSIVLNEQFSGIHVSDGLVVPEVLYDRYNKKVDFADVINKQGLTNGEVLAQPLEMEKIDQLFSELCKQEFFWKQELSNLEILPYPFARNRSSIKTRVRKELSIPFSEWSSKYDPNEDPMLVATALIAAYMLRVNDQMTGTLGYIPAGLTDKIGGFSSLFKGELPFNLFHSEEKATDALVQDCLKKLKTIRQSGTFTVDMPLRYTALKAVAEEAYALVLCSNLPAEVDMNDRSIYLSVALDRMELSLPDSGYEQGAENFLESLKNFIAHFFEHPEALLYDLPLLNTIQTDQLITNINQPAGPIAAVPSILEAFDRVALLHGEKTAIQEGSESHSYTSFRLDSLKMAALLLQKGVKPGDVVMLCLPRSYAFFVTQWAALRCRAAFLPIDSTMPDDRKKFILDDSQAVLVVTDDSFTEVFPTDITLVYNELPVFEAIDLPTEPSDLAYLIYTSGSTGVPKGVRISHRALTSFVSAAAGTYGFTEDDRVLQFSNLGFDASIEEVFCTLCTGGSLYIRTEEMLDPEVLIQFSKQHEITVWDFPTAFWRQVLAASGDGPIPKTLRAVIIGGEAVSNSDFETWKQHPSSVCRLFNTYGPTEATVVATVFEMTTDFVLENTVPIGRPLPGYSVYITDKHRKPLPAYLPGELLIAGPAVADGYLNRDEIQNKVFIHVELPSGMERCYCTGDLAFSDETGEIHYIGRADGQLKIRGFRVEPGEIENQIMQLGGISQAVVLGKANERGEKHLVAYIVPQSDQKDRLTTLKPECYQILPNYMVPDHFIEVSEIPMTPNGKIDKRFLLSLTAPSKKKDTTAKTSESLTPLQESLTKLWRELLEDETLTVDDDFFENGGHSLRAVRLMATLKKDLGVHLPLSALISCPTPRSMAEIIESKNTNNLWKCLVPIRPKGSKMPLYLIHGAGLNVLLYQSLGNHLDPDRPIYAMQAKGLDGQSELSTTIEEMASDYIDEIRKNQPQGPYAIFGFSLGGFIAYEMGRQLLTQGQEVAFLGVIDTVTTFASENHPPLTRLKHRLQALVGKPAFFLYALWREPLEGKIKFLRQKAKNIRGMLFYYASRLGLIKAGNTPSANGSEQPVYLSTNASVVIDTALNRYVLKPAPLTVDLFRAGKQMFYIEEPKTYGWSKYAQKGVVVENVPGEHSALFAPPNDAIFAKLLTDRLNEIEQNV